jgi:F-type H+-transporting ATPase subunit gamma
MATLKEISMRLKAVTNIQKITKSMKMISAAKYSKAERELKPARSYGVGAQVFYDKLEVEGDKHQANHLVVAISSDKGLCGAVHTNIFRAIRGIVGEKPASNIKVVAVGDKMKALMQKDFKENLLITMKDIGKTPPTFSDAAYVANQIMTSGYEFESAELYFNHFRSIVSYNTTSMSLYSTNAVSQSENINQYDSIDEDVLRNYTEFSLASLIFFAMKESACSEQSARMTAMESASKNAGEMIEKLQMTYNRTRQAVITRELIEIISGAAAL